MKLDKDDIANAKKKLKSCNSTPNQKSVTPSKTVARNYLNVLIGSIGVFFTAPYLFPHLRNTTYGLLTSGILSLAYLFRPRPSALMELAGGIKEGKEYTVPPELAERIARVNHLKSIAKPPPTPQEELAKLDTSPSPRFRVDDPELLTYLDTHGYVVVNLEVEPSELDEIKSHLWDFIEKNFQGWKRGEPDTWDETQVPRHVWGADKGIIFGAGIGQSEFLWRLRTLKGVKETFSKVWGDDDVITSFDGANIFRPWTTNEEEEKSNRASRKTNGGWWHVDQGRKKSGMKCAVQGFVSLFDADASTGGLCVMPKSQHRHAEVVEDSLASNDFVTVQPYLLGFDSMERKLVCCQAGDLVLWDSRTIHCNTPAPKPNFGQQNPNELLRAVGYVCMTPRSFATQDVLEMRREGCMHGVTTSHWPHEYHAGSAGGQEVGLDYEQYPEDRKALVG